MIVRPETGESDSIGLHTRLAVFSDRQRDRQTRCPIAAPHRRLFASNTSQLYFYK